jgi:hypothetical protein
MAKEAGMARVELMAYWISTKYLFKNNFAFVTGFRLDWRIETRRY